MARPPGLRLAIEKFCDFLKATGDNLNEKIGWLVSKGVDPIVQQALDAVRVIGNEAVHPGQIDLRDDRDTAIELFEAINLIADQMVTRPKRVQALYDKLPATKKAAIEQRDGKEPASRPSSTRRGRLQPLHERREHRASA